MPLTFHEALGKLTLAQREMIEAAATNGDMEEIARRHKTYMGNLFNAAIQKLSSMGFYINDAQDHFRGGQVLPPPDGEGDDALHT